MGYFYWSFIFVTIVVCFGEDNEYKCSQEKFTCNPKNLKEVNMDNGMQMICDGNSVCNSEYKKPCLPCLQSNDANEDTNLVIKTEVTSTDCNDGNGSTFPCRRHPTDRSLYIKCNRFMFHYQKTILKCSNFVEKRYNNNCKLLDVCM